MFLAACALLLSGCGGPMPALQTPASAARYGAVPPKQHLYVGYAPDPIVEFAPDDVHAVRLIWDGIVRPRAMVFDGRDNLYVADGRAIRVFAPRERYTAYLVTAPGYRNTSSAVALDSHDRLYVAWQGRRSFIGVYAPYTSRLLRRISADASALTCDRADTLYAVVSGASSAHQSIAVYTRGGRTLTRVISRGLNNASHLAIAPTGELYVANIAGGAGGGSVSVYEPNAIRPARLLTSGIDIPSRIAFDARGNVYVSNFLGFTVTVYDGTGKLIRTIAKQLRYPFDLAFDNTGSLYVTTSNAVNVYSASGDRLVRVIAPYFSSSPAVLGFANR